MQEGTGDAELNGRTSIPVGSGRSEHPYYIFKFIKAVLDMHQSEIGNMIKKLELSKEIGI